MAIDVAIENPPTKKRKSTRRINIECPYGGPNTVDLFRETANLRDDDTLVDFEPGWRQLSKTAAQIAAMTFTRADGSTFSGLQLQLDIQVAADQIAAAEDA